MTGQERSRLRQMGWQVFTCTACNFEVMRRPAEDNEICIECQEAKKKETVDECRDATART